MVVPSPSRRAGAEPESTDRRRLILNVGWSLLVFVLCLFLPAGTLAWSRGWLFFVVTVAASILITLYPQRVNPDVVAARINRHEGTNLHRLAHFPRFLVGFDPRCTGVLAPGCANDLGGANTTG